VKPLRGSIKTSREAGGPSLHDAMVNGWLCREAKGSTDGIYTLTYCPALTFQGLAGKMVIRTA